MLTLTPTNRSTIATVGGAEELEVQETSPASPATEKGQVRQNNCKMDSEPRWGGGMGSLRAGGIGALPLVKHPPTMCRL